MIPSRSERSDAAKRLSHGHSFCSAFGFLTVVSIKVEVDIRRVPFGEGGVSVPMSQRSRVASVKGTGTRGLIPVDCNECRAHIQISHENNGALLVLGSFLGAQGDGWGCSSHTNPINFQLGLLK